MTTPWVATRESSPGQREPSPKSPLPHRFVGINRARRMEAARRRQRRRDHKLIGTDQKQRRGFHRGLDPWQTAGGGSVGNRRISSFSSERNGTRAAASRGLRTISHPRGNDGRCKRNTSRRRRLTRLRTTAPPTRAGTVIPRRVSGRPLGRKKAAHNSPLRRWPSS